MGFSGVGFRVCGASMRILLQNCLTMIGFPERIPQDRCSPPTMLRLFLRDLFVEWAEHVLVSRVRESPCLGLDFGRRAHGLNDSFNHLVNSTLVQP